MPTPNTRPASNHGKDRAMTSLLLMPERERERERGPRFFREPTPLASKQAREREREREISTMMACMALPSFDGHGYYVVDDGFDVTKQCSIPNDVIFEICLSLAVDCSRG